MIKADTIAKRIVRDFCEDCMTSNCKSCMVARVIGLIEDEYGAITAKPGNAVIPIDQIPKLTKTDIVWYDDGVFKNAYPVTIESVEGDTVNFTNGESDEIDTYGKKWLLWCAEPETLLKHRFKGFERGANCGTNGK